MTDPQAIVNDTFHGKDVQLDGYSVVLTIKNVKESDFNVSYRLQLSYGASQSVQYTVLLESASKYLKKKINTTKYQQQQKNNNQQLKQKQQRQKEKLEFYLFSQIKKENNS
jgi:response regulator RpfG family c-di-GMP phosphodiesterase